LVSDSQFPVLLPAAELVVTVDKAGTVFARLIQAAVRIRVLFQRISTAAAVSTSLPAFFLFCSFFLSFSKI
jgi:hypothetical protein